MAVVTFLCRPCLAFAIAGRLSLTRATTLCISLSSLPSSIPRGAICQVPATRRTAPTAVEVASGREMLFDGGERLKI